MVRNYSCNFMPNLIIGMSPDTPGPMGGGARREWARPSSIMRKLAVGRLGGAWRSGPGLSGVPRTHLVGNPVYRGNYLL
jgi:hypothetical protein